MKINQWNFSVKKMNKIIFVLILNFGLSLKIFASSMYNLQFLKVRDEFDFQELNNPAGRHDRFKFVKFNSNLDLNTQTLPLINDLSSRNQSTIDHRLSKSYGKYNHFHAFADLKFKWPLEAINLIQSLSYGGGGSFFLTNPIFPEVETILSENYSAKTYFETSFSGIYTKAYLSYGTNRLYHSNLTSGDFVAFKPKFRLHLIPRKFYANANVDFIKVHNEFGEFSLKLRSIPIVKEPMEHFASYFKYKSVFLPHHSFWMSRIQFVSSFSPLYSGNYKMLRTLNVGISFYLFDYLEVAILNNDGLHEMIHMSLRGDYLSFTLSRISGSYDDFNYYPFTNYAANLSFFF